MPSREASLRNLEKAKRNWRAPKPLRCNSESCVIRRLVWQWHHDRSPRKWSARAVARALGASHTYVQKLVREFVEQPDRILRELRLRSTLPVRRLFSFFAEWSPHHRFVLPSLL